LPDGAAWAGSPDRFGLNGFSTDATRNYRHPPDACSGIDRSGLAAALGRRWARDWIVGTANVLTRATAILAGLFFVTSLLLSILAGIGRKPTSILQGGESSPAAPGAPAPLGSGGGLLNQLQGGTPPSGPATPAAPSGPQVPQSK